MMRWLAKCTLVATAALFPITAVQSNEVSITLRATIEARCEVVAIGREQRGLTSNLRVSVSCNAPQYQLRIVGSDGPVALKASSASASIGHASIIGHAMMVSPRMPGLHVLEVELPEGAQDQEMLMVQLDGY